MKVIDELNYALSFPFAEKWRLQSIPLTIVAFIFLYVSKCKPIPSQNHIRLSIKPPLISEYKVSLISIYRLTIHPLAKYPGPLLSKLSDWSIVIQAASGNRHLESWKEHEKYGESAKAIQLWLR